MRGGEREEGEEIPLFSSGGVSIYGSTPSASSEEDGFMDESR